MTKVGHFVSFGIGGADRAALELVKQLAKKLPDIKICYGEMSFPMRTPDQDQSQNLLSVYEEFESLGELYKIDSAAELNNLNLDILHTHRSGEDEWLIPGLDDINRNFKIVETNFHGFAKTPADFRIFPSKSLLKFRKISPSNTNSVISNIVNGIIGKSLREKLGIPGDSVVFGRVGRSDRSIYSNVLLESYAKIENIKTTLIWVGASTKAKKDAKALGVRNIVWIDPVNDPHELADYYATFDVYCHANPLGETFGNTVAEAVLRGIPVASLRGSRRYPQAQQELISDEQFCTSVRRFTKLLKGYRDDHYFRNETSAINKEYAKSNLNPESIANEILDIYSKVIE